ncbi:hypothetical protein ElyMa_004578000 [Elysia marginata]|uniref:Uncharacterized protein n=1 Tax=Elysia marginata TaxID=1093978 RepID=A0AAV4HT60_9GAST|nr:hypothetical protein ElyMa_004578000 [Elysia marginata]
MYCPGEKQKLGQTTSDDIDETGQTTVDGIDETGHTTPNDIAETGQTTADDNDETGQTIADDIAETSTSYTQEETEETSAAFTTASSADNQVYVINTSCRSVLPNGTITESSFQVAVITDYRYTQKLVESIYSHLVIPKPLLSSYRRRLNSVSDRRTSSCVLGALACAFMSFSIGLVFLFDLSSWQRHWPILKRNFCGV